MSNEIRRIPRGEIRKTSRAITPAANGGSIDDMDAESRDASTGGGIWRVGNLLAQAPMLGCLYLTNAHGAGERLKEGKRIE